VPETQYFGQGLKIDLQPLLGVDEISGEVMVNGHYDTVL
jgi:hypothetical protein